MQIILRLQTNTSHSGFTTAGTLRSISSKFGLATSQVQSLGLIQTPRFRQEALQVARPA